MQQPVALRLAKPRGALIQAEPQDVLKSSVKVYDGHFHLEFPICRRCTHVAGLVVGLVASSLAQPLEELLHVLRLSMVR